MNSATITVNDITQTPRSIHNLLKLGSGGGYTVVPSGGILSLNATASVSYLSIQASYTNGGKIIYKGDENVKTDGTRQAKELKAGDTDVQQGAEKAVSTLEVFVTASANGAIFNVETHNV